MTLIGLKLEVPLREVGLPFCTNASAFPHSQLCELFQIEIGKHLFYYIDTKGVVYLVNLQQQIESILPTLTEDKLEFLLQIAIRLSDSAIASK